MAGSDPGAGDFDPCECVWSHELATRRLINMIRQNQDYCTENECFSENDMGDSSQSTAMFLMGFWILMAVILFFLRPKTSVPDSKGRDGSGPSYDPPAPATN